MVFQNTVAGKYWGLLSVWHLRSLAFDRDVARALVAFVTYLWTQDDGTNHETVE